MTKGVVTSASRTKTVLLPPVWTGHADVVNPFEFATVPRAADELAFDVMLEAKAENLSLLRLRPDLRRHAPDEAHRFGLARGDGVREAGAGERCT